MLDDFSLHVKRDAADMILSPGVHAVAGPAPFESARLESAAHGRRLDLWEALICQPDLDGFLVGGASLDPDRFLTIIRACGA